MATYDTVIYSEAAALPATKGHYYIRTWGDDKSIRLNNRDYVGTGHWNAVQSKPNITTNTGSATSFEASPRGADDISVGSLVGFKSNPVMKGAAGDLTGALLCYQAKCEADSDCTGTIDEAHGIRFAHSMHGTLTHSFPIVVENGTGGSGWSGQFMLAGTNFGSATTNASTNAGNLKVAIGSIASHNDRYIQLYSTTQ